MGSYPAYVTTNPDAVLAYPHYSDERWNKAQLIYGEPAKTSQSNYSDRLWEWDYNAAKRAGAACKAAGLTERTARMHEAWLAAYYGCPVALRYILAGCNLATGYAYYFYGYDFADEQ